MTIGTTIKRLRRDRDITQEKLAEYLNISPQAVSRWETDLAMPDISFLPILANIFNVTTDYLLGVDIAKRQEKINEYGKQANALNEKGHTEEVIALWREALLEFPNEYGVMESLARALHFYGGNDSTKRDNYYNEALKLCEKIYEECTNDKIRSSTVQLLVFLNDHLGNKDKAREYAERMPNMYLCSETLLSHVLEGWELLEHERNDLGTHLEFIRWNIIRISKNEIYSTEEKIRLLLNFEKIFDIIYENDLEEMRKAYGYFINIAELYASINDAENTIKYIDMEKHNAIGYDKAPTFNHEYNMQSLIFKGRVSVRNGTFSKNYNYNESMLILKEISEHTCYDFIRDDQRFKDIVAELEQYAKYE